MHSKPFSRREFIRLGAGTMALGTAAKLTVLEPRLLAVSPRPVPPSDTIRYALIGTGIRGCEIIPSLRRVPGIQCVATADLYAGSRLAAQELFQEHFGEAVPAVKDYRQILDRKDVDAVFATTPDHWHRRIVEEACAAGKDVYCEKPMTHALEEGFAMIRAVEKSGRICQVGSQRVSNVIYLKAREIYQSGKLGKVNYIEAWWDRGTPHGAYWQPIPPDASPETIDWDTWLADKPKRPFDADRFFAWRKYKDYGGGPAGDLTVHFLSGINSITGVNTIPLRAHSTGGFFRWKDVREFPDLISTFFDYPEYRVLVRINLTSEGGEGIVLYGTDGVLAIKGWTLTYTPIDNRPVPASYFLNGWPKKLKEQYYREFREKNPLPAPGNFKPDAGSEVFVPPPGYSDVPDHLAVFFDAMRTRKQPLEDVVFGNNVSVPYLMANASYFAKTTAVWDAETKTIKTY